MAWYSAEDSMRLGHRSLKKDSCYQIALKDPLFVEGTKSVDSCNYLNYITMHWLEAY